VRDRVVSRYRTSSDFDPADAHSDAVKSVEPDEDALRKMIEAGITAECKRVHSKERAIDRKWTAVSEWRDVEVERVGSQKLKVTFPTTTIAFTGGNPNDDSDREGDTPTFEIEIKRIDK
jgi:hypothetical protein